MCSRREDSPSGGDRHSGRQSYGAASGRLQKVSDKISPSDVASLPFEKAMAELEAIVTQLEQGSVTLEDSIAIYERGEALRKHCETLLRNAEMRIEKITLGAAGTPTGTAPLDPG